MAISTDGDVKALLSTGQAVRTSHWVYGLLLVAALALWPALQSLLRNWAEITDYHHGYAIGLIAIAGLVQLGVRLDLAQTRPALVALPILLALSALWLVAFRGNSDLLQQVLLPVILCTAVWAAAGTQAARLTAPPLAFLYFAIPLWEFANPLLQHMAAFAVETVFALLGVPARVVGTEVTIPEGTFVIAEGCSGKRFLIVALAVAALAAALRHFRFRAVCRLLALTTALAIVMNWLRIIVIIYAGHVTNMQHYLVRVEHATFGWFVFLPLLSAVLYMAHRMDVQTPSVQPVAAAAQDATPAAPRRITWVAPALLFVVVGAMTLIDASATAEPATLQPLPLSTGTWQGPLPSRSNWSPHFQSATTEATAVYTRGAEELHIYANAYPRQVPGQELVSYRNRIVPEGWSEISRYHGARATVGRDQPDLFEVRDDAGAFWIVGRVYSVDGSMTASPLGVQLLYGVYAFWRPAPAGVVLLAMRCGQNCEQTVLHMTDFWREHGDRLGRLVVPVVAQAVVLP